MADRVLVLGGSGAIGRHVVGALAGSGTTTVVAGRDRATAAGLAARLPDAEPLAVDADDARQVAAAAAEVEVVVNCTGREDPRLVGTALGAGAHVVDISATAAYLRALARLDAAARDAGRTLLVSVGLAPGLSNLAAAALHDVGPEQEPIDITVLLRLGERAGPASRRFTLSQVGTSFPDPADGRPVRAFSDPRRVRLPADLGSRSAYRVDSADQDILTRHLGVPLTTRYAFDPPAATTAAAVASRLPGAGRILARLDRHLPTPRTGTDRWALVVETPTGRWQAHGRCQSRATAAVTAAAVRRLLDRRPPGLHHLYQLTTLAAVTAALDGEVATTDPTPAGAPPEGIAGAVRCEDVELRHTHDQVTVAFVDLAGLTELTATRGDDAAAHVATHLAAIAAAALGPDDELVKTLGDAVLLAAPDPPAGVALVRRIAHACADTDDIPPLRVGLHHGELIRAGRDVLGDTVNTAARVAAHARPGQVLATAAVAQALDEPTTSLGRVPLPGLDPPPVLHWLAPGS